MLDCSGAKFWPNSPYPLSISFLSSEQSILANSALSLSLFPLLSLTFVQQLKSECTNISAVQCSAVTSSLLQLLLSLLYSSSAATPERERETENNNNKRIYSAVSELKTENLSKGLGASISTKIGNAAQLKQRKKPNRKCSL